MLREPKVVGLVVMDSKEAGFGILNGERLELIENITSGISGKSEKGGSSQRRYERERDMELTYYFQSCRTRDKGISRETQSYSVGGWRTGPNEIGFLKR
jgi:peptide subunit release factor 1 (eRF1)